MAEKKKKKETSSIKVPDLALLNRLAVATPVKKVTIEDLKSEIEALREMVEETNSRIEDIVKAVKTVVDPAAQKLK